MKYIFLFVGIGLAQIVPFDQTLPVLTSPVVQAIAGQDLHFQLVNYRNTTCRATLAFRNATYLPIAGVANPKNCAGDQVARVHIPGSAPNGAAALEWECSGVDGTSVDLMVISGGSGDWDEFLAVSNEKHVFVDCRMNSTSRLPTSNDNSTCI